MHIKSLFSNPWAYGVGIIIGIAAILFLFQLGAKPFWDYDEAIYANVVHDTIGGGNFLDLHMGANSWFEKPPLPFWVAMGFDFVFHNPEFSYRLLAALSGILSVVLVMLITYEVGRDVRAAFISGLILLTTGPFIEAGRQFRLDIPAIAMILFSVYSFLRGLKNPRWFLGVGLGLGFGFMMKSVVGLLSIPFVLLWSILNKNFQWLKNSNIFSSLMLFLLIVAPWHAYETLRYGLVFWQDYLLHHVFQRFFSDVIGGSVSAWEYLSFFFIYGAPWSIFFGIFVVWLMVKAKKWHKVRAEPVFLFAMTALCLFVVFLFSTTKIYYYILPVYPFISIALALGINYFMPRGKDFQPLGFLLAGLFAVGIVLSVWISISFTFHRFSFLTLNDLITSEEKNIAMIIKDDSQMLDVYTYEYDYYDTIEYYSGIRLIQKMGKGQELSKPFFLIVSKQYMDWHSFPPGLSAQLSVLYKGQTIILYKFSP